MMYVIQLMRPIRYDIRTGTSVHFNRCEWEAMYFFPSVLDSSPHLSLAIRRFVSARLIPPSIVGVVAAAAIIKLVPKTTVLTAPPCLPCLPCLPCMRRFRHFRVVATLPGRAVARQAEHGLVLLGAMIITATWGDTVR